jgi:hypothetical protein
VYVIDEDEHGESYLLFPSPEFQPENPLPSRSQVIPQTRAGREAYWQVTSAGGREHVVIVASRRRLPTLEEETRTLERPRRDEPVTYPELSDQAVEELRGMGGYIEERASGGGEVSGTRRSLFEMAEVLPGGPEVATGVWVRRLALENPEGERGGSSLPLPLRLRRAKRGG